MDGIPGESIYMQLRAHLNEGATPEEAARWVLDPYGDTPLPAWAYDGVLRQARALYRRANRKAEDRAFSPNADELAKLRLAHTEFTLPDGRRIVWEKLTLAELEIKAAWLRTQIESLSVDMERIERAIDLLREYPEGTRLGDIDGWQDEIADTDWSNDPDEGGTQAA